jgi:glycosyltransferase involved in cell wall biosynthesis
MKRIGILVVAYNAASTLHRVLDRIPAEFRGRIDRVLVSDDASSDATYLVGRGYQADHPDLPLTVLRLEENLGYGGNQKVGYEWAIEHDLDIVVLLHGDGQYAPELLPDIVAPLERGDAHAVMGSRMIEQGRARRGGMPLYKYVGNRILTSFENKVMGADLTEWHSGYRAYDVSSLRAIPFQRNSDGFDFDTQVIVQLMEAGRTIVEIPIPTYYGDEISHVNGMKYALDICRYVVRYRLQKMGFGRGDLTFATETYEGTGSDDSSHGIVASMIGARAPGRVLDLGCGDGHVAARLRAAGHWVTGVDLDADATVQDQVDEFVKADLDEGLPPEVGDSYDVVLAADVFEHLRNPERLLREIRSVLGAGGVLITSVPNVSHWYPRLRFAAGRFDYDRRGILDRGHLRFFNRRSFTRLANESGYRVVRRRATGLPLDVVDRGAGEPESTEADGRTTRRVVRTFDRLSLGLAPNLFAYQWIFELRPT